MADPIKAREIERQRLANERRRRLLATPEPPGVVAARRSAMDGRVADLVDRMKAAVPLSPTPGLAELAAQPAVQRQPVNLSGRPYPDQIG